MSKKVGRVRRELDETRVLIESLIISTKVDAWMDMKQKEQEGFGPQNKPTSANLYANFRKVTDPQMRGGGGCGKLTKVVSIQTQLVAK